MLAKFVEFVAEAVDLATEVVVRALVAATLALPLGRPVRPPSVVPGFLRPASALTHLCFNAVAILHKTSGHLVHAGLVQVMCRGADVVKALLRLLHPLLIGRPARPTRPAAGAGERLVATALLQLLAALLHYTLHCFGPLPRGVAFGLSRPRFGQTASVLPQFL